MANIAYKFARLKKSEVLARLQAELALGFYPLGGGEGIVAIRSSGFAYNYTGAAVDQGDDKVYDLVFTDAIPAGASAVQSVDFETEVSEDDYEAALNAQGSDGEFDGRTPWIRYAEYTKEGKALYDTIYLELTPSVG